MLHVNIVMEFLSMYGNMVLIGTGKGEVPYLPQLLMEHNETSVKHLSYSILWPQYPEKSPGQAIN